MKILAKNFTFIFILLFAFACETDEDKFYDLSYIQAPENLNAVFDITQDNTGLVSILPNSEGAVKYMIDFGEGTSTELGTMEKATHTYPEGVYQVGITAHGITGLTTKIQKELNVTFKAPENLQVTVTKDAANPKIVSVSATATFATIIDIYFGDVQDEEPTHVLPGEVATHTYTEIGDYQVKVIAKSAGAATTEHTETITIEAASDPVNLPIDFESFTINYAFSDFGGAVSSVVDNPDASGENTSAKVGQSVKTAGAETWAGTILTLESPIDFSVRKSFKVKVWSPKAGAIVKLKVENLSDGNISAEVDATTSVADAWEELTFDFSAIDINNEYQKVVLFFDFGNVGDNATFYFDDIKLQLSQVPASSPVQDFEGEAPVFTDFGNAATEVVSNPDASGINTTSKVAKQTKTNGAETWAGSFFGVAPLDLDTYSNIKVKVWSPKAGAVVKLKLENADASITHEVDLNSTVANAWEVLTYDFSAAPAADYVKIVMFFDFGNVGDGSVYYYDEIELANESGESQPMGFQDFEGEAPVFTEFGNAFATVIANPDMSGINTTAKVVQLTKVNGAETWAGAFFGIDPLDLDNYSKISVKTWSPKSGVVVKLKLENTDASIVHEVDLNTTTANSWEQLTYDFSAAPAADYVKVVMFFDFGNAGDDSVYYFDEFELTN
jgi:hypothetical protein